MAKATRAIRNTGSFGGGGLTHHAAQATFPWRKQCTSESALGLARSALPAARPARPGWSVSPTSRASVKSATSVVVDEEAGESAFAARRGAQGSARERACRGSGCRAQSAGQRRRSPRSELSAGAAPGEVDEVPLLPRTRRDRVVARLVQILRPRRGRLASTACDRGTGRARGAGARGAAAGRAGAVPGAAATAGPSRAPSAPPCAS